MPLSGSFTSVKAGTTFQKNKSPVSLRDKCMYRKCMLLRIFSDNKIFHASVLLKALHSKMSCISVYLGCVVYIALGTKQFTATTTHLPTAPATTTFMLVYDHIMNCVELRPTPTEPLPLIFVYCAPMIKKVYKMFRGVSLRLPVSFNVLGEKVTHDIANTV